MSCKVLYFRCFLFIGTVLSCVLIMIGVSFVSPAIEGEHTDKIYTYKVGICASPDDNLNDNCGIFQYDKFENGTSDPTKTRCVGRIDSTQVTESKTDR